AVQGAGQRPARRRRAPRHEVRLWPRAGVRARGGLDRRRRFDGKGLPLPGPLSRPLASGARLPRPERELRLATGLRRHDRVREVLRRAFHAIPLFAQLIPKPAPNTRSATVGDVNGDGLTDVIDDITWQRNTTGSFAAPLR